MKSYFYGKDLETLYNQRVVKVKRTKSCRLVEYVCKYNWPEDTKKNHPEFPDYCVRCFGINADNVPFKAVPLGKEHGEKEGHLFFQYGPNRETVESLLNDPKAVYDMTKEEMTTLHIR